MNRRYSRRLKCAGFTLVELLVVIFIIGVAIALFLPNVRVARDAARRMSCLNNTKNLALALHNYHDQNGQFPSAMGGTGVGASDLDGNANRLSGFVALLPFIEANSLYNEITSGGEIDGITYPPNGPAPWVTTYPPWQATFPIFRCPSGTGEKKKGTMNYAFNIGDVTEQVHQPETLRGAFGCGLVSTFSDFKDGTSNTIFIAEIGNASGRNVVGQYAVDQPAGILRNPSLCFGTLNKAGDSTYPKGVKLSKLGRGGRWADGAAGFSLVNTILPPNSPSCAVGGDEAVDGVYSAGSYHGGGAMVAKGDGSVSFISDDIDAGDPTRPPPTLKQLQNGAVASPYGLWGALGTIAGEEELTEIP